MKPNHKKQGEEADDMIRALQQEADNGKPDQQEPGNDDAITAESTDADNVQQLHPTDEPAKQETPPAEPAVEQPAAEVQTADFQAQLDALTGSLDAANQRWKVAQGMIEKKDSELEHMRTLLAGLASQQAAPKEDKQDAPAQVAKLVTAADIEDFGQPTYDFVVKVATDVANSLISAFDATVSKRVTSVQESVDSVKDVATKSAAQRFDEQLTQMVPDWQEINVDPGFGEWVAVVDEYTGVPRVELLRQAYEGLDAKRTAVFFQKYKETLAPAEVPAADPEPAPPARDPAKLVSPGKSRVATSTPNGGKGRVWTRADIGKLYDDHMAKRISQDEFDKAERDIFKAQQEGRIVG